MTRAVQVGPRDYLVLDAITFHGPSWAQPHPAEPEVRHFLNGTEPRRVEKPCWCPLPADHPLHIEEPKP